MNLFLKLTITLFLCIQTIAHSQTDTIQMIFKNKYNTLLKEKNNGVAILIKKNNKKQNISLGNFNLTQKSVFNIGSATKTFTVILLLQELEKGNVKLTDSIGQFLTPLKNVDPSITIKTLMTHESGLDEVIGKNIESIFYAKNDSLYSKNLLYEIKENNPKMIGKFNYCNTNYFLLGKIIEKVTDKNYSDLLRERIFMPLNMHNTYPYVHKNIPNLAIPFHKGKDVSKYLDHRYFMNVAYAAGSIASTLTDMEKFYTSLFETEILLKKETIHLMKTSGSKFYGLGLFKSTHNNETYFGHGGNNIGYAFRNKYNSKTKDLFLMFTNSRTIPLKNSITNDALNYLSNKKITNFNTLNISKFKSFTGSFLLKEANLTLDIITENNKMYLLSKAQGVKSQLVQKNETTLYDTTVGATLQKIEGDENSLQFSQNGFKTTIKRIN
ncbi:serine hydrolase [Tenacibaculum sp.]|nr:serine hydrolase [Tenacibaculum sp.]